MHIAIKSKKGYNIMERNERGHYAFVAHIDADRCEPGLIGEMWFYKGGHFAGIEYNCKEYRTKITTTGE